MDERAVDTGFYDESGKRVGRLYVKVEERNHQFPGDASRSVKFVEVPMETRVGAAVQLISDLMGVKAIDQLFQEVWQLASPEVKEEISNKILSKLMQKIENKDDDYHTRSVIEHSVGEWLRKEAAEPRYYETIKTLIPEIIQRKAQNLVPTIVERFFGDLNKRLEAALRAEVK